MKPCKALYLTDRKAWRRWLRQNHATAKEIWLVYPHKDSGRPRISYNDAVEEALCFGWIDSTVKRHGPDSSMQRFTPRNPKSRYSQPNKERLRWCREHGLIHPSMGETVDRVLEERFVFPRDILDAIGRDREAWRNYRRFSESYRRIRVAYIDAARSRPDQFEKRLANFIRKTREGKPIGFGGIEKFY